MFSFFVNVYSFDELFLCDALDKNNVDLLLIYSRKISLMNRTDGKIEGVSIL